MNSSVRNACLAILLIVCLAPNSGILASIDGLNTMDIVRHTTEAMPECFRWKLVGQCFWLHCGLTGCDVRTTPKVSHYRPDFVVAVQMEHNQLAWQEMKAALEEPRQLALATLLGSSAPFRVSGGGVPATNRAGASRSLRFFEADVFGHPMEVIPTHRVLLCDGVTDALRPYYQSALDALAWREPLLDLSLQSLNPFSSNVGSPHDIWGSIKPRCGWIHQPDPYKAAAVAAFRAVHILTHPSLLHISLPLHSNARSGYHPPLPIRPRVAQSGAWQQLYPQSSESCETFGSHYSTPLTHPGNKPSFLWNLWRSYTCCRRAGQTYLGDIDF